AGQQSSTGTTHAPTTQEPTTHAPTTRAPTTHAPTTQAPTTPTTAAPTTTTAAPPTPPQPWPPVNMYVLRDRDNQTCMMMNAALQLKVSYLTNDSQWKETMLVLDNKTIVDLGNSSCGTSKQTLALRFFETDLLSLTFTRNETIYMSALSAQYTLNKTRFPDAKNLGELVVKVGNTSLQLFGVEQGRSYLCSADSSVYLGKNTTVDFVSVQLQAFVNSTGHPDSFGSAVHCVQDNDISNIVPIAVGSALAALVVIVLLAYLVGRSRSRQKGYQSV
ncbi:unnamed protein product, partial [Ixodes hexagonus]